MQTPLSQSKERALKGKYEVNLESKSWVTGKPTQSLSQGNVGCVKLRTLNGVSAWNEKVGWDGEG